MARGKKTGGKNFEPGISGNPSGRPKLSDKEKIIQKLTKDTWNDLCEKMMRCTKEELEDLIAEELPYESELFIRHMLSLGETLDWNQYQKYLDRRIGKVQDEIKIEIPKPTVIHRPNGEKVLLGVVEDEDDED